MTPAKALLIAALLAACTPPPSYRSGEDYLSAKGPMGTLRIDADIARAANVTGQVKFPARIGVAKFENGRPQIATEQETALFADNAKALEPYGSFIPMTPLSIGLADTLTDQQTTIKTLRLAAARQHLDLVLIVEMGATSTEGNTALAIADVTLIGGAILPTRKITATATGQALLVDVRNGYPYGAAQATKTVKGLGRSFGTYRREGMLLDKAMVAASEALFPEIVTMLQGIAERAKK